MLGCIELRGLVGLSLILPDPAASIAPLDGAHLLPVPVFCLQFSCCDLIWLPGFEFTNVVGYSQDRYVNGGCSLHASKI